MGPRTLCHDKEGAGVKALGTTQAAERGGEGEVWSGGRSRETDKALLKASGEMGHGTSIRQVPSNSGLLPKVVEALF